MKKYKKYFILGMIVFIVILLALTVLIATGVLKSPFKKGAAEQKGRLIEENLTVPNTQSIFGIEGKLMTKGPFDVPLVPKSDEERIVASNAVLTVKGVYDLAIGEAKKSADDSKLSFIKSFGIVMIDGKSSQWQAVFSSKSKKKAYEFIVHRDKIVSFREFASEVIGADLPSSWFDSDGAIKSIQSLPQFTNATVSYIGFYYDTDSKMWMYSLNTSLGATSIPVK